MEAPWWNIWSFSADRSCCWWHDWRVKENSTTNLWSHPDSWPMSWGDLNPAEGNRWVVELLQTETACSSAAHKLLLWRIQTQMTGSEPRCHLVKSCQKMPVGRLRFISCVEYVRLRVIGVKSMHAISSYRGNRQRPPVANPQTWPITIHCAAAS